MQEFFSSIGPWLLAVFAFFGWKGLAFLVAGMWFGDFAGRKYPNAWAWVRAGLKTAGDAARR
jgi:hypothetical protein